MKLIIRLIFFCLLLLIIITCLWLTLLFYTKSYNDFIEWLAITLQKSNNWISFFKSRLSVKSFHRIKSLIIAFDAGAALIIGLGVYHFRKIEAACIEFCLFFSGIIKKRMQWFSALPAFERYFFYVVTIVAIVKALWYSAVMPLQYDEAWSYNYFISNELWQSFLLPSNNHKLFTFIAWWFNLLPFDKVFLIRLPNAIAGAFLLVTFFHFAKKYFSSSVALSGFAWFATCVPVAVYMTIARSYIYVIFFSLLLLIIYFEAARTLNKKYHHLMIFLTITIVLGYFSNPTFFFGHFILSIYIFSRLLFQRQFKKLKPLFISNLAALPFLCLIYATDMLGGHFSGLLDTAYKDGVNQNYFLECIKLNAGFQTGIENMYIIFVIILLAGFTLCFTKYPNPKSLLVYAVLSIAWLPIHASIVHDETSRHKTIFITISFTLILLFILQAGMNKLLHNKYALCGLGLLMIALNTINLNKHSWFKWSTAMDKSVKDVSSILMENNATVCYIKAFYYKPGIEFYHKVNFKKIKLYLPDANSVDYNEKIFIKKDPQFVLTDPAQPGMINRERYSLVFKDEIIALYKINKVE